MIVKEINKSPGFVLLDSGIKTVKARAIDVIFSMRKNELGKHEFNVIVRGIKLFTVTESTLLSHFNGKYKSVTDAYDKSLQTIKNVLQTVSQ